jgi:DNA invertase Pin-like site-specific DNA recombinase
MTARKRAQRAGTADLRSLGRDGKSYPGSYARNAERDEQIRRLRATGMLLREIAAEVGCCRSTVERALRGQRAA